jgi:hypothetical protein
MVPEQGHLFFKWPLGVYEIIHPIDVAHRRLPAGQQRRRLIPEQLIGIDGWLGFGMQQLLYGRLVPLCHPRFEFVATRSEPRASHQVRHQSDVILVCHL